MADDRNQQQGEGDREADRHYRESTRDFVESGKVDEATEKAREQDPEEAREAEKAGRERAREEDPELHRDYDEPTEPDR